MCLTHPHADHYSGMFHLFEEFTVGSFWCFHLARPGQMARLFRVIDYEASKLASVNPAAAERRGGHFRKLLDAVSVAKGRAEFTQKIVHENQDVYPPDIGAGGQVPPGAVHIRAIAPTDRAVQEYFDAVNSWFDEHGDIRSGKLASLNHNDMSVVFWIEYGSAKILLCADLEARQWQALLARYAAPDPHGLAVGAVKVAHHGSLTGLCDGLWPALAAGARPIAVVTPSVTHGLPDAEALREIAEHSAEVWLCSTPAAAEVLSLPELSRQFGPVVASQILDLVHDFVRVQPSRSGYCSLTVSHEGGVDCEGQGGASRLLPPP